MPGTVTETRGPDRNILKLEFDWVADAAAATVPDTPTAEGVYGYIVAATTIPGSGVAPTSNYDVTIEDEDGVDVMGGALLNRSATANEQAIPMIGGAYGPRICDGLLTLKVANNAVNSATGKVVVWIDKKV